MSQDAMQSFIVQTQPQQTTGDQRQSTSHTAGPVSDESTLESATSSFVATLDSERSGNGHEVGDDLEQIRREYLSCGITHAEGILRGYKFLQQNRNISEDERLRRFTEFLTSLGKGQQADIGGRSSNSVGVRPTVEQLLSEATRVGEPERDGAEGAERDELWEERVEKDEEGKGSKRIRPQDFPWYEDPRKESRRLTDSMRQTRVLLELNQKGLELAQRTAQGSSAGPHDFPESEWANIVRGRPVSLDNVFAGLYRPRSLPSRATHVGGVEVIVQDLEPGKKIETAADWSTAWRRCVKATSVVFPHRIEELSAYGEHIEGLFASIAVPHHWRVLCYDEAVRNTVRGGESSSLLDDSIHQRHTTSFLSSFGTESDVGSSKPRKEREKGLCRWFNGKGFRPKYLRYNHWDLDGRPSPSVMSWSEKAEALPSPPNLPFDHAIMSTIRGHPHLFQIVTPLNVHIFRQVLIKSKHPNPDFCNSVCDGFVRGFWPWANVEPAGYPETHDEQGSEMKEKEKLEFVRKQRDAEVQKGRFSGSFGQDLLPGMYSVPIFAVPKEGTSKLRLVTDQSAGKYPVNGMTTPHEFAFPMDNLVQLGEQLLRAHRRLRSGEELVLFKSDVSEAYRLLPVHPIWQIKQIVTVDSFRHVDRNNVFGGRRSGDLFITFMSLVMWIACHVWGILGLCNYVDDVFGVDLLNQTSLYKPYNTFLPSKQARLLEGWDKLGIPHKREKQLNGQRLTIIGWISASTQLVYC
ncbi:hypothetical protein Agabi119p4_2634 [Agaricus bisporus var. burnettii]|uniref:Reverse transcriptase domain-containing protein n=1 Tax=Agaricus bisporus var. burnettii TaxID=192524 RepID=A0A8H7KKG9_AGABI|nr:hypothetical protein Agabi119p4_2634 [Agaricus bisporus var. burnettii]